MNLYPNGSNFALANVTDRKYGRFKQFDDDDDDEDEDDGGVDQSPNLVNNETNCCQPENDKHQMSLEQIICEDLHEFENRLMEIVQRFEPKAKRWRWILALSIISTIVTAIVWLLDVETFESSFWHSLWIHPWFTLSCLILISLFLLLGIHKRVIQHHIIAQRIRDVLSQFNMDCDDHARLILMPKPSAFFNHIDSNQYSFYGSNNDHHQHYSPPYHSNGLR